MIFAYSGIVVSGSKVVPPVKVLQTSRFIVATAISLAGIPISLSEHSITSS